MTYKNLLEQLSNLNNEQLNQDVTIYHESMDEYCPVSKFEPAKDDGVLDEGHFVLKEDW